uniref:PWWP domain-containing protein n=1 Tax=Ixodes ricinus TaxID=34613 RepID=V5II07_IXORI
MAEPLSGSPVNEPQSHQHEEVAPTLQNGEEGLEPPEQPPKPAEETPSRYKPAMLKLMAMLASQEPPTPTKSLPSKMERLTFRNSTPARKVPEKAKAYKTYFRQQSASSQIGPSAYACQKCSFRTSRMDNLVRHNKSDCAFVKDFFSWDANTFTEATQLPKKRSLSPDTNGGVVASMAETSVPKRKGVPRRYLELSSKSSDRRKSTPSSQSKSQSESIEDGSDPEDEPSLSNATPHEEFEFSEDDVVWVEWKRLHWPALVLKLYPSTRKAKVFLIDSITSKETVMINVKKIFDFNSAERTKRFLNEGRVGRNSGALVKAVQKAEEFLRKRCLGININARQFFCDEEVRFTEDPPSEASDDSYVDCSQASPEELGSQGSDTLSEAALASKERRKLRNEKLVDCIKGGKVNSHLLGVLNGTVPSERHKRFHSNVQSDRIQLKQWSWFGPIDNASQQEEIYEFCFELLKANSDLDDTFDIASYVIEVWCPEAVMKALCRVRRVQMDRAEEILVRAVVPSAAEYEMKCREMMSIPPTPEEKREHKDRLRTEFRDLGIADDILAALEF